MSRQMCIFAKQVSRFSLERSWKNVTDPTLKNPKKGHVRKAIGSTIPKLSKFTTKSSIDMVYIYKPSIWGRLLLTLLALTSCVHPSLQGHFAHQLQRFVEVHQPQKLNASVGGPVYLGKTRPGDLTYNSMV